VIAKIVTTSLLASSVIFIATPAQAAKTYKSCAALNKVYPYGAGVKKAKDKVTTGFSPIKNYKVVSAAVYKASKKLDKDKDKILCELPKYKNCAKLNTKFPNGLGLKGAKDKSTKPVTNFKVASKYIYNTNAHLDRDKDKISCEK
jgi:hypothetical protein